ncbi:MAG: AAA family ATPase, partial [Candidatus Aenigmatarchaeota archaeon]
MELEELKSKVGQVVELEGRVERVWLSDKNGNFALKLSLGNRHALFVRFPRDNFKDQKSLLYEFEVGENVKLVGTLSWSNNKNGVKILVLDASSYKKVLNNNNEDNLKDLAEKNAEYYKNVLNEDFNPYEVIFAIRELEGKINEVVKKREEMVRLLIISSIYGANTLLIGKVGVGKTMSTELVSHMFSDKVFYFHFNRNMALENVIGHINIVKLNEGNFIYETDRFLGADFHIYDEFFQTHGRLRAALNDYLAKRVITVDQIGVLKGNTRAIFATTIYLPDLNIAEILIEMGDYAITESFHLVYDIPDLSFEEEVEILKYLDERNFASYETIKNLKKELSELRKSKGISVETLEQLKAYAISNVRVPDWVYHTVALFAERTKFYLGRYYSPSIRKAAHLINIMKVNAVLEGRNVILPKDVELILSNTLFSNTLFINRRIMKRLANKTTQKPIVDKAHLFYEAFSNVDLDAASLEDKKKNIRT